MATSFEFDSLDEEVKELLQNYKHKKASCYEPCTQNNFKECLIGLSEEFGLLNIPYIFNPHICVENNTLCTEALVNLINSVWILIQNHKSILQKSEHLEEQNYSLEQNNKQLNAAIGRLNEKLTVEKNESKACVSTAQRVADRSDEMLQSLVEARAKLVQLTKQKLALERNLKNEISRLKLENQKLLDKVRNRSDSHIHTSCSDVCSSAIFELKERDKKQRSIIARLQTNNQELLHEVIAMKEELILGGNQGFDLTNNNT